MKPLTHRLGPIVLVLAMLGTSLAADHKQPKPFVGKARGAIVGTQPVAEGVILTTRAEGTASRLGRFTRAEMLLLDPATGQFSGEIIFTTVKGHRLTGEVVGAFVGPTTATGTYRFTGGTGPFAGATGGARFIVESANGVDFTVVFLGDLVVTAR